MEYRIFLAAVVALMLAACTSRPTAEVEYVATINADGTPHVIQGMRGSVRVRVQPDSATRRVTMLLRVLRGDSLIYSEVSTLGEEKGKACTMFGTSSWTCVRQGETWTFDNKALRLVREGQNNAMVFLPQPASTP